MQGNQVKVSVIVIFYNAAGCIGRCARSLLNQSMDAGIEFIFVDDGSSDGGSLILERVIKEFPSRSQSVRLLVNDSNCGISASRQRGLDEACGEYVIYCDADDYVDRCMYENMYIAACNTGADIAVCDYYEERDGDSMLQRVKADSDRNTLIEGFLTGSIHGALWNKLVRRRLYSAVGRPFIQGADMLEDVSVMTRLAARANVVTKIDGAYYHYNRDLPQAATRRWTKETIDGMIANMDRVIDFFRKGDQEKNLDKLKARLRLMALYHSDECNRQQCRDLYPDVPHRFRLNIPVLTAYQRFIACCRDCSVDFLADMLIGLRSVINRFRK